MPRPGEFLAPAVRARKSFKKEARRRVGLAVHQGLFLAGEGWGGPAETAGDFAGAGVGTDSNKSAADWGSPVNV